MNRLTAIGLLGVALMLPTVCTAQTAARGKQHVAGSALSKDYEKCIASTDTNAGWSGCSTDEIDRQEKWLLAAWKEASAAMRETVAELAEFHKSRTAARSPYQLLLDGQRAWVTYKDTACLFFAADEFGREGTVLHFGACKASIIADRVEELKILTAFLKR